MRIAPASGEPTVAIHCLASHLMAYLESLLFIGGSCKVSRLVHFAFFIFRSMERSFSIYGAASDQYSLLLRAFEWFVSSLFHVVSLGCLSPVSFFGAQPHWCRTSRAGQLSLLSHFSEPSLTAVALSAPASSLLSHVADQLAPVSLFGRPVQILRRTIRCSLWGRFELFEFS